METTEQNRKSTKRHYYANKSYYLEKNRKARERKAEYLRSLRRVPCCDCGVEYPHYVMEFDHVRGEKLYNIANMLTQSWKRIHAEVEKCEVVCANCHCSRTHARLVEWQTR